MGRLQSQGVHHVTLAGADRQTSIDFWEGLLGMPFVFEHAIEALATRSRESLSEDRSPKQPYRVEERSHG